jgi:hypothetical protein
VLGLLEIEMAELVIKIPGIKLDEKTKSAFKEDIRAVIRLRWARELLLKRLDKMLQNSSLTDEECLLLADKVKEGVAEEWKRRGKL